MSSIEKQKKNRFSKSEPDLRFICKINLQPVE